MRINLLTILASLVVYVSCVWAQAISANELILEKGVVRHTKIDDVYRRFSEAYRKLDPVAVTNLYTGDAFYLSPGNEIKRGREKILADFSSFFSSVRDTGGNLSISFRILDRRVSGDLAYDVGIYTLAQKRPDSEERTSTGKFVVVARRINGGDWRFHIDSYSDLPSAKSDISQNSINAQELEKIFDPIFAERMEKLHIPGAVIMVVKDGKILFTKGYGHADIDKKTPVIPDKTIFRIGSITKVFTATAVMQLADSGKIKLTDDVNKYLKDARVPNTFPQPITFHNLLTHTSGLDEISPGRRTSVESELIPLRAFLKTRIVRQRPPNEVISYSTYNPALAALAVEQIAETPFRQYLRQNIFEPLGMNRTSISYIQKDLQSDLATGYENAENKYQKLPFQWFHTFPSSDINTTASDMALFMIANLQGGAIDGKRILSERAVREMQQTHFRNHPRVPGWAYGFYEGEQNDLRFIEHGGSMDDGYSGWLTMFPEKNLGIFLACNTEFGCFGIAGNIKDALLNRYFPVQQKIDKQTEKPSLDALKKYAGKYRGTIYCHSCPANSGAYVPEPFEVKIIDDGMLSFFDRRWRQIGPLLFVSADGERAGKVLLGFKENSKGEIVYMFHDAFMVYEKVLP